MQITTPQQMVSDKTEYDDAIVLFEELLKKEDKGDNYYHLVIHYEISAKSCEQITKLYKEAGWGSHTICTTSSMQGERPGLTGLQLYRY